MHNSKKMKGERDLYTQYNAQRNSPSAVLEWHCLSVQTTHLGRRRFSPIYFRCPPKNSFFFWAFLSSSLSLSPMDHRTAIVDDTKFPSKKRKKNSHFFVAYHNFANRLRLRFMAQSIFAFWQENNKVTLWWKVAILDALKVAVIFDTQRTETTVHFVRFLFGSGRGRNFRGKILCSWRRPT